MKKYIIIISFLSCVFATSFTMETKNAVIGNFTKSKEQNDYRYAKHILLLKKELKKLDNPLDVYKPDEKKFITHSIKKRTIDLWQKNFQDLKNIFEDELYCQDEEANTFWKELKKNPLAMNIDLDFSSINEIFLNAYQAFLVNQEQIKTQKLIANLLRLHKLFQIIKFMPFWVAELDRMSLQKNSIDELFLVRDYFVKEFPSSKKILAAILQKNFKDVLNIIEKECNVIINNEFFIDEQAQDKIIFSQVETSDKNFVKESSENEKLWKMYAERSMTLHQLNYKNSVHIGVQYQKLGLFCDKKFLNQVIHEFYETIRSFSKEKNLNIISNNCVSI